MLQRRLLQGAGGRDALVAFCTLCVLLAGHTMLETARDAMFLASLPAERLPIAYLAMAAAVAVTTRLNAAACRRFAPRMVLTATLLGGSVVTAGFWLATDNGADRLLFALYVWPGLITTTALVQLWLRLHDALDVERAKHLYAAVGAGGLLGAFLGSAAASGLVELFPSRGLLLASSVLYAGAALLPLLLSSPHARPLMLVEERRDAGPRLPELLRDTYARHLVLVMFAMAVCTTFVDFLFKWQVAETVPRESLPSFFARFYMVVNVLALCAQVLLVPWLLRRADVHRAVLVLPLMLAACGLGAAIMPALAVVLVMRGTDGVLRHSLFGTASEIFYLPLRGAQRDRLKGLAAAAGQRGGQAVASLAILGLHGLALGPRALGIGLFVGAMVGAALIVSLRQGYVARFHARLREHVFEPRAEAPRLDIESLESLMTSLSAAQEDEVVAALDLLHMYGKDRVVPPLILHHPSEAVVMRALDLYARDNREDVKPLLDVLMRRREPAIRAAALRTACAFGEACARRALAACAEDAAPVVVVTRALAGGRLPAVRNDEERQAMARGLTLLPAAMQARAAHGLLSVANEATRIELARALLRAPLAEHFDALIRLLARPTTRELARSAIHALGEQAMLGRLQRALADHDLDRSIRLHLPRTISRFGSAEAALFLSRWLAEEHDERVAFKVLRGLGRMRADRPRLAVDVRALYAAALHTLNRGLELLRSRWLIERAIGEVGKLDTPGARLSITLLDERLERIIERAFRILHVVSPRADFHIIHASCYDDDARMRAAAHEILAHLLPRNLRAPLVALLRGEIDLAPPPADDDAAAPLNAALATGVAREVRDAYPPYIASLSKHSDVALAAVARSHLGELGLDDSAPEPLDEVMRRLAIHASGHRQTRPGLGHVAR